MNRVSTLFRFKAYILNRYTTVRLRNTGWSKKRGHRRMTIILSILNRFYKNSPEDSLANLQLNGYQKFHRCLHITLLCETLMSAKQAINNKLQGSVATY